MPVVTGIPVSGGLRPGTGAHRRRTALTAALSLALIGVGPSGPSGPAPASRELLDLIWRGVDEAQERHVSGCGTLTEKRVSPLLVRPLVMHGTFCAAGIDLFRVEYAGPEPARIIYNRGALNVSTDGGKRTEAFDVSRAVQRAQRYFAGPHAPENLERDFSITVAKTGDRYALLLLPVSGRIARRVKRVAVELGKLDFLPRRLEIDGKNGVNSIFEIQIERLDAPLDEGLFQVYRP
jgi:hypothetical protein